MAADGGAIPVRSKAESGRQLILDLSRAPCFDPDEFLPSPSNAEAYAAIARWPDWSDRVLLLIGPAGAGKSHLGAIWAARAGARIIRAGDPLDPASWIGPAIALVEDGDRAAHPESALFHLINLVRETGGWLLLTARTPPDRWKVSTPDLLSRLRLPPVAPIGRPDTELIRAVIVKLFADRQIRIEEDVVAYAARHCDQSLEAVSRFVAAVDEEALVSGRRITRPLAAQTIAKLQDEPRNEKPALEE